MIGKTLKEVRKFDLYKTELGNRLDEALSKIPLGITKQETVKYERETVKWDSLEMAINHLLLHVSYNYKITVGELYHYEIELSDDKEPAELIIGVNEEGAFVKDVITSEEAEDMDIYLSWCSKYPSETQHS